MPKSWMTTGSSYGLQDGNVYIKKHDTLTPFVWGGRCWRLEDSSETLGGMSITTRFDPRGGVERDSVRPEAPGETSGTLIMKRLQADRAKTDLKRCYWDLDLRMHCAGGDRDAWTKWEEITRFCYSKFNERGLSGTNWEGDEEAMVNLPYVALSVDDIYRVSGSEYTAPAALSVEFMDVDTCQSERCPDKCDDQEDCIVVAVTRADTGVASLVYNLAGGDDDDWTAVTLTTFAANDATKVLCLGSLIIALSPGYKGITYSNNLGATQTDVGPTAVTTWNTHAPACIDGIDQSFIIVGCADGYITVSYDAGMTWETVSSGEATTNAIGDIMIARDNPQVIYASSSAADVVIKSENGGRTWDAVAATGCATGLTALYVINRSTVLAGNSTGQLRQTTDGGATWTEQDDLPGVTTKATSTINDITGCGCGVLYLTMVEIGAGASRRIYRNVDGGAEGRWYVPADLGTLAATTGPTTAITCCGPNHAVAVGGLAATNSSTILIE